jgi:hypothetical protein
MLFFIGVGTLGTLGTFGSGLHTIRAALLNVGVYSFASVD